MSLRPPFLKEAFSAGLTLFKGSHLDRAELMGKRAPVELSDE